MAAYGFSDGYLMDAGTLRGLIVDDTRTSASPGPGFDGIAVTVKAGYQIIDIRSMADYARGFIPGSETIPGGAQFSIRIREVHLDGTIVLVSDSSYRNVASVIDVLVGEGVAPERIFVLEGGYAAWVAAGYPTNNVKQFHC